MDRLVQIGRSASTVNQSIVALAMSRGIEHAISVLATAQHGVVSRAQLLEIGLSPRAICRRVAAGRLHRLHPGVFAVGHTALSLKGRWMAATLACGPGCGLCGRTAARLHGLIDWSPARIEVASPRQRGRAISALHVIRVADADALELTEVDGIPCTGVERTLIDCAAILRRTQLEAAFDRAERSRLVDHRKLQACIAAAGGKRGIQMARQVAEMPVAAEFFRSELERRFLALVVELGLERPQVNAQLALDGRFFEVDFLWRSRSLIVEVDGAQHAGSRARIRDAERDVFLGARGYTVARFTGAQLSAHRERTAAELTALLAPDRGDR